jgi:glyoxylase-like metal-dependent hydrolase (beta-lactamase superfamily II)
MGTGNAAEWIQTLQKIELLTFNTIVPGHGGVGTRDDVQLMKKYLLQLQQIVMAAVKQNKPLDTITTDAFPAPFNGWNGEGNLTVNVQRMAGELL